MKILIILLASILSLQAATFSWNANSESDISYYRLYVGTSSGNHSIYYASIGAGTNLVISNALFAKGTNYYAALTAINTAGLESTKSLEISFVITNSPPNAPVNLKFIAQ